MADYGKIINRSIEITKKYKWLWVYGLVAAAGGGSVNFNNLGNLSNNNTNNTQNLQNFENMPQNLPDTGREVLGTVTNTFSDWLKGVEPTTWVLLVLGFLFAFIIGIAISWVLQAWANGSLIGGLALANQNKEVSLKNTSPIGLANIRNIIVFDLINIGIWIAVFFGGAVLIGIAILLGSAAGANSGVAAILALLSIPLAFVLLAFLLIMMFAAIFGPRFIVLKKMPPWPAWKAAWRLSLRNFFPSFVMGVINTLLSAAFGCGANLILIVLLGIPSFILLMPVIQEKVSFPGVPAMIFLFLFFIIFIVANTLINAVLSVFKRSNWNLFFEEINKVYEGK